MRGSWVLVVATVPYKYCTAKSPPASSSHRVKTHRSKNRQWLEHVDRIQVFMCPPHLREISSDVLRYFWEIFGSFFADRDETEKNQRLATSETSKLQRYILWSFEQIQINKAFPLQKIEDKACPPDTIKWVFPPQKTVKNKTAKLWQNPDFPQNRYSFFQFPRADPLDDSRWGPGTPTLTQTSGNVELQHKTSGTWKKCKHLSSRSSLLLGPEAWAERLRYTQATSVTQLRAPHSSCRLTALAWKECLFSQVTSWMQMMCPQCPPRNSDFSTANPGLWSSLPQQPLFVAEWPAHLEAVVPAFAALETAGQTQRFWFMIASQGRRSEGKQPVSLAKYDWRIFSMPTGIHPLSFPHKPCQCWRAWDSMKNPSECIYKYTKLHVYTQLLNIS